MIGECKFQFGKFEASLMLEILSQADADSRLSGFVYPKDLLRTRLPIFLDDLLVGFATPRKDKDEVWRMGAIYVLPAFRNRGLAKRAIADFMKNRKGRAFIENDNHSSRHAYRAAGFRVVRKDEANEGCWWENF